MLTSLPIKTQELFRRYDLQLIAIIASCILSGIILAQHQPFNIDGIIYLAAAQTFLSNGLHAAMAIYPWPFYSVLIATTAKFSHLSLEHSAYLLNTLLNTATILSFIALVKILGGSRKTQFFGLIVILIYPYLNHSRGDIERDLGYYAFALLSCLFFIRYLRTQDWPSAINWGISIIIATLFRVEGAIFMVIAPFAVLLLPKLNLSHKILSYIKLHTINLICLAIALLGLILLPHHSSVNLGRLPEFIQFFRHGLGIIQNTLTNNAQTLQKNIPDLGDFDIAFAFILMGLVGVLLQTLINTMGLAYVVLVYHALRYKLLAMDNAALSGWLTYLLLNIIIVITFLLTQFFLSARYTGLLCLLLIITVPFSLATIHTHWQLHENCFTGKKWLLPIIAIIGLILLVDSTVHFGTSKTYLVEAGTWINQNTSPTSRVFSNDAQLAYYTHRINIPNLITLHNTNDSPFDLKKINLGDYDYLALVLRHDQTQEKAAILKSFKFVPKIFQNNRGDEALIIQLSQ